MQTSSPPVITPNRSQSNPDDMITLPRPIQSVGMDLHDVSGTSTGQTPAAGKKGSTGHPLLSDNLVGIPTICYYFYPPPTIDHFFIHFCPKYQAAARILRAGPQAPGGGPTPGLQQPRILRPGPQDSNARRRNYLRMVRGGAQTHTRSAAVTDV